MHPLPSLRCPSRMWGDIESNGHIRPPTARYGPVVNFCPLRARPLGARQAARDALIASYGYTRLSLCLLLRQEGRGDSSSVILKPLPSA